MDIILTSTMFKNEQATKNPKPEEHKEEDDNDDEDEDAEKIVVGDWKIVDLPEQNNVGNGEEFEDEVTKFRAKIYRFHDKQWKERGVGELKVLKHKNSGKIRLLCRGEKTHKCILNHYAMKHQIFGDLQKLQTSNNSWTWAAQDIADEVAKVEKFCVKFTSKEQFERFETVFNESSTTNAKINEAK